jgi:hypothetical protein
MGDVVERRFVEGFFLLVADDTLALLIAVETLALLAAGDTLPSSRRSLLTILRMDSLKASVASKFATPSLAQAWPPARVHVKPMCA